MNDCRYAGHDQPRVLRDRHGDECEGGACRGCQPCTEPHCRVCGLTHTEGACAECVASTREDLHTIGAMCDALPVEVIHRGVESEAMTLLGPAADPEAWGHVSASVKIGRLPEDYISEADGELHPLFALGTWDMCWRAELEHDEPAGRLELVDAVDYLDQQMTYMAGYEHAPFEDFARDLRRCRAHLEMTLHDGEQRETGAPCMQCDVPLRKCWAGREMPWSTSERTALAASDGWACPRCRLWHTEDQYRFAVKHLHRAEAEWLTDRDMELRTNIKAGTVRSWAREETALVRKRRDSGRTLYSVDDVMLAATDKGILRPENSSGEVVA